MVADFIIHIVHLLGIMEVVEVMDVKVLIAVIDRIIAHRITTIATVIIIASSV